MNCGDLGFVLPAKHPVAPRECDIGAQDTLKRRGKKRAPIDSTGTGTNVKSTLDD